MGPYVMSLKDKLLVKLQEANPVDPLGLISPERMDELRAQAREKVKEAARKKAEDAFLSREVRALEQEANPKPEFEMRSIIIDVAEHTDAIRIDNQYFFYGQRYEVPRPVYDQLQEIMARGFAHEREISVPNRRTMSMNRGLVLHGGDADGGVRF